MLRIADSCLSTSLPIEGLRFEQNALMPLHSPAGWFATKLASSPGPLISDFVTHETGFKYDSFGIHVGQDDRLTFMGRADRPIVGSFVDCRLGSPTLRVRVDAAFAPSLARRLIIPRGVAHTFDGLAGVVTRDEPVWHASESNRDWNIDNDLVSVDRNLSLESFPIVRANEFLLPDSIHVFQSRLSQSLLQTPKSYLARYRVTIAGEERYVMFRATRWGENEEREVAQLLTPECVPGTKLVRAKYALTGPRSWTLVPSTDSCIADVLVLPAGLMPTTKALHSRTRIWYTFLSSEGATLTASFSDRRKGSSTFKRSTTFQTVCDPRVSFVIDPGVAYSFGCSQDVLVRAEQELFAAQDEPRADLKMFGQDVSYLDDTSPYGIDNMPTLPCPSELVRLLARNETNRLTS